MRGRKRGPDPEYTPEFVAAWSIYRRGNKAEAFREYISAVPSKLSHEQILSAYGRYYAKEITDKFAGWDMSRWIRDGRWEQYLNSNGKKSGYHNLVWGDK